jgi:SNF2 family DNA or RNA helicase
MLKTKPLSTQQALALIPKLEGKARVGAGGAIQCEDTPQNRKVLAAQLRPEKPIPKPAAKEAFNPILPWRGKQGECFDKMKDMKVFAVLLEMGCGKTKLVLDNIWYKYQKDEITGALIVVPSGLQEQWMGEQIPKHLPPSVIGNAVIYNDRASFRIPSLSGKLDILIIHLDALRTKKGEAACNAFLKLHAGKSVMVIDESHRIKSYNGTTKKAACKIGIGATYRRTMTGTPLAVSLLDEWSQFDFLDPKIINIKYVTIFRARYCIMGGFKNKEIIGHRNLEHFNRLVDPYCYRATKESLGLPPKIYDEYSFDLSDEQLALIKQTKRLKGTYTEAGQLVKLKSIVVKIQQITNGFLVINKEDAKPEIKLLKNPRIDALKNVLAQLPGSVVIWARFVRDILAIKEALGDDAVTYYGANSPEERHAALSLFQAGRKRYFVSNEQTGGTGLELQAQAPSTVYYSPSTKPLDRRQSEDRTHRIGISKPALYVDLIANKGVDRGIIKGLAIHRQFADTVLQRREALKDGMPAGDLLDDDTFMNKLIEEAGE